MFSIGSLNIGTTLHGGDGEEKLYFALLKSVKRKKAQFRAKCLNSFCRRLSRIIFTGSFLTRKIGYPFDRVAVFFEGELVLPIFVVFSSDYAAYPGTERLIFLWYVSMVVRNRLQIMYCL